jgi:2-polyprenyl-6-methoxyphenol hydroxylase-like FAD-dependent oxidoreductase
MTATDIVIAGGGLAGSTAAAMLGRAGHSVTLVDPHETYPPDFRAEKIDVSQAAILRKTGLAGAVLRATTPDGECWVARMGRVVDKRSASQFGFLYETFVNALRAEIPPRVRFIHGKVADIATSEDQQRVTLSNGEDISARLVIVANGLNVGLRDKLGMTRHVISKTHSIMLGFDLVPASPAGFPFQAMTYYGENIGDRAAYITLFPIGQTMRANLAVYRDMDDPWLREFRSAPREALMRLMPGLSGIAGAYDIPGKVQIRPADLYTTTGYIKPGIVLVGDAFSTSCPAAGTGVGKVLTDVERLCNVHVPYWLATGGMGAEKIAAFYADPTREAYHAMSHRKAFHLRALTVEPGLIWAGRRFARFAARAGIGLARSAAARWWPTRDQFAMQAPAAGTPRSSVP